MAVGNSSEEDLLHFKKNKPDLPPGFEPGDQPPYVHQAFPAWIYHEKDEPRLVKDDSELANFLSRGWAENPNDARKAYEAVELEKSNNAAQRISDDARMSDTAKAEHEAADSAADDHVLDLPVPKLNKKPGPKPKTAPDGA